MYLREIGQVNLLTAADEVSLAKRIQRGMTAQKKLEKKNGLDEAEVVRLRHAYRSLFELDFAAYHVFLLPQKGFDIA